MSQHKPDKALEVGDPIIVHPGSTLHFYQDPSLAEDDPARNWTEVEVTGEGEPFFVPRHWHKHHDEIWEILEGRFEITSGDKTFIMNAGDPIQRTPRRSIHALKSFKGERAMLKESTTPTGEFKARYVATCGLRPRGQHLARLMRYSFFRDLFAIGPNTGFWYSMRAFYEGDGYVDLGLGMQWLDEVFIFVAGNLAKLFVPANKFGPTSVPAEQHQKRS